MKKQDNFEILLKAAAKSYMAEEAKKFDAVQTMKKDEVKIAYSEPEDYFPEEIRKKYKLGEYAEERTLLQYISYYVYDFESEAILVADGDEQATAYDLYAKAAKKLEYFDKWAFDIALDCVRNFTDKEIEDIKKQGKIADYHFGYGMYVRNKYVHKSKKHLYPMADDISSFVERFIYAII